MKKSLNGILVVEGKEDASYLSNYIDSEIVTVQGYEIPKETIEYLKNKKVIIFTDPDGAGKKIREKLNCSICDAFNVEIDIKKCTRGSKNGVAECEIGEIMEKLEPFFVEKVRKTPIFTTSDLYNLGVIDNKDLRAYVCQTLSLGRCNNKQLLKRLNLCNIQLDELKKVVEKYRHGN